MHISRKSSRKLYVVQYSYSGLIVNLSNFYLAFSFFHFSMQLGVNICQTVFFRLNAALEKTLPSNKRCPRSNATTRSKITKTPHLIRRMGVYSRIIRKTSVQLGTFSYTIQTFMNLSQQNKRDIGTFMT